MSKTLDDFGLLLYQNFLLRKRKWKLTVLTLMMIPLLLYLSRWAIKNTTTNSPPIVINKTYPIISKEQYLKYSIKYLYVVPNNQFTNIFMDDVRKCLWLKDDGKPTF